MDDDDLFRTTYPYHDREGFPLSKCRFNDVDSALRCQTDATDVDASPGSAPAFPNDAACTTEDYALWREPKMGRLLRRFSLRSRWVASRGLHDTDNDFSCTTRITTSAWMRPWCGLRGDSAGVPEDHEVLHSERPHAHAVVLWLERHKPGKAHGAEHDECDGGRLDARYLGSTAGDSEADLLYIHEDVGERRPLYAGGS